MTDFDFFALPVLEAELPQGTIRYREVGSGPTLLFVHGLLVSGSVWRKAVARLSKTHRCVVPDLPLGSHTIAMRDDADLSVSGIATIVEGFMRALGLEDVTLVGNDSGGAICQVLVARAPARVTRLVLTTCDAFEVFPPKLFAYLGLMARLPGAMTLLAKSMAAMPFLTRLPIAYGKVARNGVEQSIVDRWVAPAAHDAGIRRDVGKFMRSVSPSITLEAARALHRFDRPVLLVWSKDDEFFPLALAHRLQRAFPDARLEVVDDSGVFVSEDRPEKLAQAIQAFVPLVSSAHARA